MALGADRASVMRLIMEQGAVLAALGTLLGVLASLAAGSLLESMVYEVSSLDPLTATLAVLILGTVSLAATALPAVRAAASDPAETLRAE